MRTKLLLFAFFITLISFSMIAIAVWNVGNISYDKNFKDISAQTGSSKGLFFNTEGKHMFLLGADTIYGYKLTNAWNVSSLTSTNSSSLRSKTMNNAVAVFFNGSGTVMYIVSANNMTIYQYILTVPWDVSAITFQGNYTTANTSGASAAGIFFNPSGNQMYIVNNSATDTVLQYWLGEEWNVSTAVYQGSVSVSQASQPVDLFFNSTGNKMFVLDSGNDAVYQYTLSTAWNVSTATYDIITSSVVSESNSPQGFFINASGNRMFMNADFPDNVYQYTLRLPVFSPNINSVNLSITNLSGGGHDVKIIINATDRDGDIDNCFVGSLKSTFANDLCILDIGDVLVNSSVFWVNDSANANGSVFVAFNVSNALSSDIITNDTLSVGSVFNTTLKINLTVGTIGINRTNIESYITSLLGNSTNFTFGDFNQSFTSNSSRLNEVNGTVFAVNETVATSCTSANVAGITRFTCISTISNRHSNVDLHNLTFNVSSSLLTSWTSRFANTETSTVNSVAVGVSGVYTTEGAFITISDSFSLAQDDSLVRVVYDIPIIGETGSDNPAGGGGGGGGGTTAVCGEYDFRPSELIGYGVPGADIAPFVIYLNNGQNATAQSFAFDFSGNLKDYCHAEPGLTEYIQPGGRVAIKVICTTPGNRTTGNLNLISSTYGCNEAIPIDLSPSSGLLFSITEIVRLSSTGNFGAALLTDIVGLPAFIWGLIIFFIAVGLYAL